MIEKKPQFDASLQFLIEMYEKKIPFNRVIGMRIESLTAENTRVKFQMKEKLIGNYIRGFLHGGVISSVLDVSGGIMASVGVIQKMTGHSREEIEKRLATIGTIDLRIDFLRPGIGKYFISNSSIMRAGRRVTVTRMELTNSEDLLIAVGTGTYVVG